MRRVFSIIIIFCFVLGCSASRNKVTKSEDQIFVLAKEIMKSKDQAEAKEAIREKIEDCIGFSELKDMRPNQDASYMVSIREKVSEEALKALRDSGVFNAIHYPLGEQDLIEITGIIHKFTGETSETMVSYMPVFNVFTIFGLPSQRVYGEVEISLEFKNKKTGEVIKSFREKFSSQRKYNIYSFKPDKEGEELSGSFAKVIQKLIDDIRKNKDEILDKIEIIPEKQDIPEDKQQTEEQVNQPVVPEAAQADSEKPTEEVVDNAGK